MASFKSASSTFLGCWAIIVHAATSVVVSPTSHFVFVLTDIFFDHLVIELTGDSHPSTSRSRPVSGRGAGYNPTGPEELAYLKHRTLCKPWPPGRPRPGPRPA